MWRGRQGIIHCYNSQTAEKKNRWDGPGSILLMAKLETGLFDSCAACPGSAAGRSSPLNDAANCFGEVPVGQLVPPSPAPPWSVCDPRCDPQRSGVCTPPRLPGVPQVLDDTEGRIAKHHALNEGLAMIQFNACTEFDGQLPIPTVCHSRTIRSVCVPEAGLNYSRVHLAVCGALCTYFTSRRRDRGPYFEVLGPYSGEEVWQVLTSWGRGIA